MDRGSRDRLDRLRTDCGCRAGALGLLLSLSGYGIWTWMQPIQQGAGSKVLAAGGVGLAGAVSGKLLGIAWSRYRYRVLARRDATRP